uniref:Nucleoprotein n=1 Tax=Tenuivirus oryzaclavatae TaxID=3052763 RepID=Q7T439_9VIRU|nr:coat protein [Tenuivirus oryzaclavatae]AAP44092.1 coat protein [Tenuivirus oryzaclavatae]
MGTNKATTLADLQKAINDISKDALNYLTAHKADVVTFAGQIEYAGYDAATLIGILKDKGGDTLAKDMTMCITMRYVRGTGFVRDVTKKVKVAAGSTEASTLVSRYGIVSSVGSNANAITLGRLAQLFPNVSHEVVRQISGVKMAVDSSDLGLTGCDNLLWDYVPQYIKLESETAPYCTTHSLSHILFVVHIIHSFQITKKTMPEGKKKERGLTKDIDMMKYTTGLLVITCKSKNLIDKKKEDGRKKVLDEFIVNGKVKTTVFDALAGMSVNTISTYGNQTKLYLAQQSKLMKILAENTSKTATEVSGLVKDFFEDEAEGPDD